MMLTDALERPLPKPRRSLLGYAAARALEALLEALLALRFLEEGLTRNAAGKAFQAWRALTGALLALYLDRAAEGLGGGEAARWLRERGVPRVPTSRLKPLARLVEGAAGIPYYEALTAIALDLHDYQYQGPDPSGEFSRYPSREDAAADIVYLVSELARIVEEKVAPELERRGAWAPEHQEALERLRERLSKWRRNRAAGTRG